MAPFIVCLFGKNETATSFFFFENFSQVIVPDTYLQNPPTDPANPERPVTVSLSINIINIDKINTAQMMFALTMMVSLEWTDHRLKFNNLKKGL